MNGLTAYALSKKYTEESLKGAGALKGEKGEDGLSIKALSITQDSTGKIIDATATLSDNTTLKVDVVTSEVSTEERLEGDGAEYYTLAPTSLSFRSDAPLNELQDVQINGVTVDPSNYTLEEGSTIVTFPIEYLKTLETGDYEVTITSKSKSVKGGFTVAAPELNEHSFYYNQPYTANLPTFGGDTAFFVREDGTYDIITVGKYPESGEYTMNGNNIVATHPLLGTITCTISSDGTEIFCNELQTNFKLSNSTSIAADEDYIYTYKEDLGGYEVTAIDKTKAKYGVIKTGINGFDTVKIADKAFYANEDMVIAPTIPNSVTTIGKHAFCYCDSLASITIPNSVTTIGGGAFYVCSSLTSITIPNSVTTIGDDAFYKCSSLTSVTIQYGVTSIGKYAFYECSSLTSIIIPDSVTTIDEDAFSKCSSLTSITIPDSVTTIGFGAFWSCSSLTSITIPDSVTTIGYDAFWGCSGLTSVTIQYGVTSIYERVFQYCSALNTITFNGTIAQWNAIEKGDNWNDGVPATHVQCSDGTVALT